jgi:hypothetical protein
MLDGLIAFIWFVPAYIMNFAKLAQQSRGNPLAVWINLANDARPHRRHHCH